MSIMNETGTKYMPGGTLLTSDYSVEISNGNLEFEEHKFLGMNYWKIKDDEDSKFPGEEMELRTPEGNVVSSLRVSEWPTKGYVSAPFHMEGETYVVAGGKKLRLVRVSEEGFEETDSMELEHEISSPIKISPQNSGYSVEFETKRNIYPLSRGTTNREKLTSLLLLPMTGGAVQYRKNIVGIRDGKLRKHY